MINNDNYRLGINKVAKRDENNFEVKVNGSLYRQFCLVHQLPAQELIASGYLTHDIVLSIQFYS